MNSPAEQFVGHVLSGHDEAWHDQRRQGIGGSDAKKIMDGDWPELWRVKTGREPDADLSDVLPVQLGSYTEPFNLAWFTKNTGKPTTGAGCDHLIHPDHKFMRANLDGRIVNERAFIEAKHVNAFSKDEEIVSRYYPQVQHCLAVTGLDLCYLSVLFGTMKYEFFEVPRDEAFIKRLIIKEAEFWGHVENNIEPAPVAAEQVAVSFDDMREVNMRDSNAWAQWAGDWLAHHKAAKTFDAAVKELKALVEPDVKLAFGHGIRASRSKAGAITIRAEK